MSDSPTPSPGERRMSIKWARYAVAGWLIVQFAAVRSDFEVRVDRGIKCC